jgi:hypothetical protein
MRGPVESHSDVILRLVEIEMGGSNPGWTLGTGKLKRKAFVLLSPHFCRPSADLDFHLPVEQASIRARV